MWRFSILLTIAWAGSIRLLSADPPGPADWPQYNYDNRGWRFNGVEHHLRADNVASLEIKWRFPPLDAPASEAIGAVHATPVDEFDNLPQAEALNAR